MTDTRNQHHGQAILETAKDHLAAVLEAAPRTGWSAVEWAEAAGLLLEGAPFAAVFAHHMAPVLVREGRVALVGEDPLPRYSTARPSVDEAAAPQGAATSAPQPWEGATDARVTAIVPGHPDFPQGAADEEEEQGPPPGLTGPWIP